ncbi:hypothetical protein GDO81_022939 [Engystomops pustulosus]|uniref:Secreted protein n=1 Tax=Engystomops pustulosus TaxID=76066 RepID=A0AAV6YMY0_ENGPU|nr:hypothetical protein GDO81_022939 [Engystomops pustulosus]
MEISLCLSCPLPWVSVGGLLPPWRTSTFPCSHQAALCIYTQLPVSLLQFVVSPTVSLTVHFTNKGRSKRGGSRMSHNSPVTASPIHQSSDK